MTKAKEEARLCIVCEKKTESACSHIDCPNRTHAMGDPFDSSAYEGLSSSGAYKRKSAYFDYDYEG